MTQESQPTNESVRYLSAKEVAPLIPGNPSEATIRAWMRDGYTLRIGGQEHIVRLQHYPIGSRLLTTTTWVTDFLVMIATLRDDATGFSGYKGGES